MRFKKYWSAAVRSSILTLIHGISRRRGELGYWWRAASRWSHRAITPSSPKGFWDWPATLVSRDRQPGYHTVVLALLTGFVLRIRP
ncbi:hypothetical protein ACOJBM_08060 [Rhizobium beringeri]